MRKLSDNVLSLLALEDIRIYYLVDISITTSTTTTTIIKDTTLNRNITVGDDTYLGNGRIQAVQPPRLSSTVDREAYQIILNDSDFSIRPYLEDSLVGAFFRIRSGFFNTSDSYLSGANPGFPITTPEDVLTVYEGNVDTASYTIDFNSGQIRLAIEGSSPMGSLGRINGFYTSKEQMQRRDVTDTSFDQVYVGSTALTLLWGKDKNGEN